MTVCTLILQQLISCHIHGKKGLLLEISYQFPANAGLGAKGSEAPLMAFDALILTINKFLVDNELSEKYPISTLTPEQFNQLLKAAGPKVQEQVFRDLTERACLHGGDSDSTGAIAFYIQAAILKEMAIPKIYLNHLRTFDILTYLTQITIKITLKEIMSFKNLGLQKKSFKLS